MFIDEDTHATRMNTSWKNIVTENISNDFYCQKSK